MRITITPLLGLFLILGISSVKCQQQVDGSGSGDLQGGDDEEIGSGAGAIVGPSTSAKPIAVQTTTPPIITNDNEDGDDDDDIILSSGNGDDEEKEEVLNGSGHEEVFAKITDPYMKCSESFLYCWCVDKFAVEISMTRQFIDQVKFAHNCTSKALEKETIVPVVTTTPEPVTEPKLPVTSSDIAFVEEDTTTTTQRPTTKKVYPTQYVDVVDSDKDGPIKLDKPADVEEPGIGADHNGLLGNDDGPERTPVQPEGALFTHPGILAAVIGGGVVALLCALLLIMFIVYRMRKKDEGSYPLDPDSKPPRLHTYTRGPNKEFYA